MCLILNDLAAKSGFKIIALSATVAVAPLVSEPFNRDEQRTHLKHSTKNIPQQII